MKVWERLAGIVRDHGAAALVSINDVKGSAPREAGACMIVRPDGAFHGSIGGGHLEWRMMEQAVAMLSDGSKGARFLDQALGPDLGQCCGGRVRVLIETFGHDDLPHIESFIRAERAGLFEMECRMAGGRVTRRLVGSRQARPLSGHDHWVEIYGEAPTPLALFGAGHVGRALVLALAPLPFTIRWIDNRQDAFPTHIPLQTTPVCSADPALEIEGLAEETFVLVMTHDHAIDLAITAAALHRGFPYLGLIGSETKRARFEKRFREAGLSDERIASFVSPIGIPGISGKEPAVIAASVTAQLLQVREKVAHPCVAV